MEEIIKEAIKLKLEGRAETIDEAIELAKEILGGKTELQQTIEGLKGIEFDTALLQKAVNNYSCESRKKLERDLKALRNAISYLENIQEETGEENDLPKVLFILEQKAALKNADFINKIHEEVRELEEAIINHDRENQFEELLDIIQIALTTLVEVIQPGNDELIEAIGIHNNKLLVDRHYRTKMAAIKFLFEE